VLELALVRELRFAENQFSERAMNEFRKPGDAFRAPNLGSAMFEGFCRTFFTRYSSLSVEGRQHLPHGPFLLCSNHTSHADSAALMTASDRSFQSFALVGASDYFFHSWRVRWLVSPWMNVIPIERKPGPKSLMTCLASCRQFLQETRGGLILYPEGTRSPDGEMRAFKSGVGLFAIELGVPVVPAYIEGTHKILPKGKSLPRAGAVTVRFGEPLTETHWRAGSLRERRRRVVEELEASVRALAFGRARELVGVHVGAKGR
jgi:1-acyl-sn-glycerol-3-phosphate acyltransferase